MGGRGFYSGRVPKGRGSGNHTSRGGCSSAQICGAERRQRSTATAMVGGFKVFFHAKTMLGFLRTGTVRYKAAILRFLTQKHEGE
ncbi:ABC transporter ATP-binding protein [Sesbania bispinosa]|nr:ABC transporter ATP-binding protein [Sesbania bispinosa]